jgi:hypothetical protein
MQTTTPEMLQGELLIERLKAKGRLSALTYSEVQEIKNYDTREELVNALDRFGYPLPDASGEPVEAVLSATKRLCEEARWHRAHPKAMGAAYILFGYWILAIPAATPLYAVGVSVGWQLFLIMVVSIALQMILGCATRMEWGSSFMYSFIWRARDPRGYWIRIALQVALVAIATLALS